MDLLGYLLFGFAMYKLLVAEGFDCLFWGILAMIFLFMSYKLAETNK